ncbi:MAG: hypothetical protein KC731_01170 [Myxococcales bacterium]|nr:hypothetical protein [Myxococcales bacterium]
MWARRPNADELLDARLARGWRATPTGTVNGACVLGHAATRGAAALDEAGTNEGRVGRGREAGGELAKGAADSRTG